MADVQVEARAKELGWAPREEWRGPPEKWVDADAFVERGEQIHGIVKSHNRKLESTVSRLEAENRRLAALYGASQESITELQAFHEQNVRDKLAEQKRRLAAELAAAREDGDTVREVEVQTEIAALAQPTPAPAAKPAPVQPAPAQPQVDPAIAAWQAANPWFGTDSRKTQRAMGIANLIAADSPELSGEAFTAELNRRLAGDNTPTHSKVGGGRPSGEGGGGGGGGSKGFDSLPPDAQAACRQQGRKLVGEGRAFKDEASWQSYYAKQYFIQEDKQS